MMKRQLFAGLATIAMAGCASVNPITVPYDAYPAALTKAQTAVVISMDRQGNPPFLAVVKGIDGQQVRCDWNFGCPVWARVGPGTHEFSIRYEFTVVGLDMVARKKDVDLPITIADMKPTHVYVVRYQRDAQGGPASTQVVDLGERPQSGILFPFGVPHPTAYVADF